MFNSTSTPSLLANFELKTNNEKTFDPLDFVQPSTCDSETIPARRNSSLVKTTE